ncbi:SCO1860 family LAETG-anchored protein [Streptomyces sp. WSLK1-5]|uniref:SCO1860 family LAETG-anchored protein n=1 Tax=unclassified Streptomyces TaxID=2593676 RepID=UPI00378FF731
MNSTDFRMPARRLATVATATALAAGPTALAGAGTAHATGDQGRASAVVLRTGLDVGLLDRTAVPLAVTLNEVQAPRSARQTALTAKLDGVDEGRPFSVLAAEAADARATVTDGKAEASTRLTHAKVHVPGLPLLSLIEVEGVTSEAVCEAGKVPTASSNLLGAVTVLGKKVTVTAGGPTHVKVPGVGEVRLDLSKNATSSRSAAATALELTVSVDPLKLGVAEVKGTLTLAKATCESPAAPTPSNAPSDAPADDTRPQGGPAEEAGLAETGTGSATPYLMAGAIALLVAGGGAVAVARRRG